MKKLIHFSHGLALWLTLSVGLSFTSCNTAPKVLAPSAESIPVEEPTHGVETIAILGTNDIHGTLAPTLLRTYEKSGPSTEYFAGGVPMIATFAKTLQAEYGERFLWLDAGDEFQGSLESNLSLGAPLVEFFNQTKLNGAAIGNHEFDFGQNALRMRMIEAKYPYLAANIFDKTTHLPTHFPNTYPDRIYQMGRLKVGVIGLSTLETPVSTRTRNVENLEFENLKVTTLREAERLREKGVHLVVIAAHAGLTCMPTQAPPPPLDASDKTPRKRPPTFALMKKPTDIQGGCGDQDEIVRLVRSLPLGTVDAIVSGHTHTVVHHWVSGVPVIQGGAFGRYVNVIYLSYDWAQRRLLTEETRIEGPIPVCPKVFKNQNDCNGDRPAPKNGRGPLVSYKFHGKTLTPDSDTTRWLEPLIKSHEAEKNRVLGTAVRPIEHFKVAESPLGNLIADSIREAAKADFAYINPGGPRTGLEAGPITFGNVFQSLPFDNEISILKVSAQELQWFLQVAQNGTRGFGSVSGLRLRLIDLSVEAPFDDLNHDGIEEFWETKRLLEIRLPDGKLLNPDRQYTLATSDFLVTGGDGLAWPISQISAARINLNSGTLLRDALVQHIQTRGQLNSSDDPLFDPNQPRLIFERDSKRIQSFLPGLQSKRPRHKVKRKSRKRSEKQTNAQGQNPAGAVKKAEQSKQGQ